MQQKRTLTGTDATSNLGEIIAKKCLGRSTFVLLGSIQAAGTVCKPLDSAVHGRTYNQQEPVSFQQERRKWLQSVYTNRICPLHHPSIGLSFSRNDRSRGSRRVFSHAASGLSNQSSPAHIITQRDKHRVRRETNIGEEGDQ